MTFVDIYKTMKNAGFGGGQSGSGGHAIYLDSLRGQRPSYAAVTGDHYMGQTLPQMMRPDRIMLPTEIYRTQTADPAEDYNSTNFLKQLTGTH